MVKVSNLKDMTKGWLIGDFYPSLFKTDLFEVAVKHYKKGDSEDQHMHKIATEYTVIVSGEVLMNGIKYDADSIIEIKPEEVTNFIALEDTTTVVVKIPCVIGDKFIV